MLGLGDGADEEDDVLGLILAIDTFLNTLPHFLAPLPPSLVVASSDGDDDDSGLGDVGVDCDRSGEPYDGMLKTGTEEGSRRMGWTRFAQCQCSGLPSTRSVCNEPRRAIQLGSERSWLLRSDRVCKCRRGASECGSAVSRQKSAIKTRSAGQFDRNGGSVPLDIVFPLRSSSWSDVHEATANGTSFSPQYLFLSLFERYRTKAK